MSIFNDLLFNARNPTPAGLRRQTGRPAAGGGPVPPAQGEIGEMATPEGGAPEPVGGAPVQAAAAEAPKVPPAANPNPYPVAPKRGPEMQMGRMAGQFRNDQMATVQSPQWTPPKMPAGNAVPPPAAPSVPSAAPTMGVGGQPPAGLPGEGANPYRGPYSLGGTQHSAAPPLDPMANLRSSLQDSPVSSRFTGMDNLRRPGSIAPSADVPLPPADPMDMLRRSLRSTPTSAPSAAGEAAMDGLRSSLRNSPMTAPSVDGEAAMGALRQSAKAGFPGESAGAAMRTVGGDLAGRAMGLARGLGVGELAGLGLNRISEAAYPTSGAPGFGSFLDSAPNLANALAPPNASDKDFNAWMNHKDLTTRQPAGIIGAMGLDPNTAGPVPANKLAQPTGPILVPNSIGGRMAGMLGGPKIGEPVPAAGTRYAHPDNFIGNTMKAMGMASPGDIMAGNYRMPNLNPFSIFDPAEPEPTPVGSGGRGAETQIAKGEIPSGVMGSETSVPTSITPFTTPSGMDPDRQALFDKLSAMPDKPGLPGRVSSSYSRTQTGGTPGPEGTDTTRDFLQKQLDRAQARMTVQRAVYGGGTPGKVGSGEGYVPNTIQGYRTGTTSDEDRLADHATALDALQQYDMNRAKTSGMTAEAGKTGAEAAALSGKGDAFSDPAKRAAMLIAKGVEPETVQWLDQNHPVAPGNPRVGVASVNGPVNGLNLPSLMSQRYPGLRQFFQPGSEGYQSVLPLNNLVRQLDDMNIPGYQDPESEVGQVIRQGITQRYGEGLPRELDHPIAPPSGWLDRNIVGPIGSFGGNLPWIQNPALSKAWDWQRNYDLGRRANAYWKAINPSASKP